MTFHNLRQWFEMHSDSEYLRFERVANKRSRHPDIHCFILLEEINRRYDQNKKPDEMICSAEHDEIWLYGDPYKVAGVITEDEVIELIRCGLRLDLSAERFAMFV